jgi:hypothetical protein
MFRSSCTAACSPSRRDGTGNEPLGTGTTADEEPSWGPVRPLTTICRPHS